MANTSVSWAKSAIPTINCLLGEKIMPSGAGILRQEAKKISLLVVGLGNVAVGYNLKSVGNGKQSHLFSISNLADSMNIEIDLYAIDSDPNAIQACKNIFPNIKYFSDIESLPVLSIDVVLVCVPIVQAWSVTEMLISKLKFRHLLLEKPGVANLGEVEMFNNSMARIRNTSILYSRRSLPSTQMLRSLILNHSNEPWKILISYSGSAENILTHFLDLLEYLFDQNPLESIFERFDVKLQNTALTNLGDHSLLIRGPIDLDYLMGGKIVKIATPDKGISNFNFEDEIDAQIWHTAQNYLTHTTSNSETAYSCKFPRLISRSIQEILPR